MTIKNLSVHKNVALAIAIGYTLFLTILSLISVQGLPTLGSSFDDKIYHSGAYFIMTMLWYYYFLNTNSKYKILWAMLFALTYGIIVEVLQGTFTTYRTEDIMDVLANSLGVLSAVLLIFIYRMIKLN